MLDRDTAQRSPPTRDKEQPVNAHPACRATLRLATAALTVAATCSEANAQMSLPASSGNSDWTFRAGASVLTLPKYPGAKKMRVVAFPDFELRYKDLLFADPIRGLGFDLRPADGLELRASLGLAPDVRRAKDESRFEGLKDIKATAALNLGATYKFGDAFVESTLRSRLGSDDRRGTTVEGVLGYNLVAMPATQLGVGLSFKAMDARYARTFFGVTAEQSAASGLPAYTAGSGLNSAGVFAQVTHQIDKDWFVSSHIESLRLRGDAASSPFTQKKQQVLFIFSALRSF